MKTNKEIAKAKRTTEPSLLVRSFSWVPAYLSLFIYAYAFQTNKRYIFYKSLYIKVAFKNNINLFFKFFL